MTARGLNTGIAAVGLILGWQAWTKRSGDSSTPAAAPLPAENFPLPRRYALIIAAVVALLVVVACRVPLNKEQKCNR